MPVFALRVALSLLLCLLVIDPDCTTKITIKLQMDPHFAEASLQLSEVFSLYYVSAIKPEYGYVCVFLPTVRCIFGLLLTRV